ncbi:MAG: DUF1697 domain-containing protein [Myxococcales bacterium]|nr:DUF1697 domain-containing protein [Myxococcales bacterium]
MTRYALLLRGVNVGTKNSLPMAELRAMLTKLGCTDVQTYVQSGNAVFGTKLSEAAITKAIEHALGAYMGRPIATTIRTLTQMKAIVDGNPFANVATKPAYLCVTFLSHAPTKAEVAPLQGQDWKLELFKIVGKARHSRGCPCVARSRGATGTRCRSSWRCSMRDERATSQADGRDLQPVAEAQRR